MDQITQAQSNIDGSHSGNKGNKNVTGNSNVTVNGNTINMYGPPDGIDLGVGNKSGASGEGDGSSGPYCLIPYCRNSSFTGRKNHVELVRRFCQCKGHNRVALHGLGGSGKTQIALEYAYQRASESGGHVFWVQGSGAPKFGEGFRAIAQHARVPIASTETNEEEFLLGIRKWFEGPNSGDWVLVIDNADDEADFAANNSPIARFIPQGPKGTLIFTTRSLQVASRQSCKIVEVGEMGEREAQELFSKRFGSWDCLEEDEKKVLAMILGSVHHLPLAVVGSAAFMFETATPPSVYWAILQENEERMKKLLLEQFCDIQREADGTESILGTHFVTFDRIGQQMPAAADLLRLMAFFDRQNIPEELLSQSGLGGMDDSVEFRRAIGKLLGFSLVTAAKCEDKTLYELHCLVQLSLQVYLPTEELNQWRAAALKVISKFFPRYPDERRYVGPAYIPHALAVTKDSTGPAAEDLCFRMGRYFLDMGSYNNAETQFRRCIALRQGGKEYCWDDQAHWRHMLLGLASARQGRFDESEMIHRRVLEECEKLLGPDHPDTLESISNLALVLREKGKYDESETMNWHALAGREKVIGPDRPDTLESINNLAMVLQDQGKYYESEAMNRRALEGRKNVLGSDHPDTLESVNNLALVLGEQGKYEESEKMNWRALDGYEKVLGLDHPNTLRSANNLAMVLRGQGKYCESEAMNRRVLLGRKKILGPDHPDTLESINNLALVLGEQGKYDESETMNRHALEGREKVLGPAHPKNLTSVNNLAMVLRDQGKYVESEMMIRRALEGYEKVLGPDHPNTLRSLNNLAMLLRDQGKYDKSEGMIRRALGGYEKVLGPHHPNTLRSVSNLAAVLQNQGKYDESEQVNRRALEGYKEVLGPGHPDTLTSINSLAILLRCQGRYDESLEMNRYALEGRKKVLGPNHPHTLTSVLNLAAVLHDQGKYEELEVLSRHTVLRLPRPPDPPGDEFLVRLLLHLVQALVSTIFFRSLM